MSQTPTRETRKGHGATTTGEFLYHGRGAVPTVEGIPATIEVKPTRLVIRAADDGRVLAQFGVAMKFWAAAADDTTPAPRASEATPPPVTRSQAYRTFMAETVAPIRPEGLAERVVATEIEIGDGIDGGKVVDVQIRTIKIWASQTECVRVLVTLRIKGGYTWQHTYETHQQVQVAKKAFVELTKAQAEALREVRFNMVSYQPGRSREWAAPSDCTRYSYDAHAYGKRERRTASVTKLADLGLVDHASVERRCEVTLTRAGRAWLAAHPV